MRGTPNWMVFGENPIYNMDDDQDYPYFTKYMEHVGNSWLMDVDDC